LPPKKNKAPTLTEIVSGCPSVHPSIHLPAHTSVKFGIGDFYENLFRNSKFGSNWAKICSTLNEDLHTIVASNIKSPQKQSLQVLWYQGLKGHNTVQMHHNVMS